MNESTLNSPLSAAELCRRNSWKTGTRLVGNEGYGPTTIEITAIGARLIIAREVHPRSERETLWTLSSRDWHEVTS